MKNELVIIWTTGEKEVHGCSNWEDAEEAERGFWMAFGNQISWSGVR